MNSIELLAKQIETNQQQMERHHQKNIDDHKELFKAVNETLSTVKQLSEKQIQIEKTVQETDKRVKSVEEHERDRQQAWSLALKVLGVIATIGAIVGIAFKFV